MQTVTFTKEQAIEKIALVYLNTPCLTYKPLLKHYDAVCDVWDESGEDLEATKAFVEKLNEDEIFEMLQSTLARKVVRA